MVMKVYFCANLLFHVTYQKRLSLSFRKNTESIEGYNYLGKECYR